MTANPTGFVLVSVQPTVVAHLEGRKTERQKDRKTWYECVYMLACGNDLYCLYAGIRALLTSSHSNTLNAIRTRDGKNKYTISTAVVMAQSMVVFSNTVEEEGEAGGKRGTSVVLAVAAVAAVAAVVALVALVGRVSCFDCVGDMVEESTNAGVATNTEGWLLNMVVWPVSNWSIISIPVVLLLLSLLLLLLLLFFFFFLFFFLGCNVMPQRSF